VAGSRIRFIPCQFTSFIFGITDPHPWVGE
jgi:hypothetical protein